MYTPEEYEKFIKGAYGGAPKGSPAEDYEKKRDKENFHKGDKGLWWQVQFRDDTYSEACPVTTDNWEIWVPPADPQPDPNKVTPEILSELAFNSTKLPAPPVELQPRADRLLVNLGTRVAFKGDLDRVWTTASINYKGVQLAATTVATPVALKVDAGTADADPQSCTYDLVKGKGGYTADSEGGAGCNVTYLRSSGSGTYPFKASITWKVTWTDSADPDGPPQQPGLPDGLSTFEQDVTVKEAQAVNRASGGS
jgi:enoyl reductase